MSEFPPPDPDSRLGGPGFAPSAAPPAGFGAAPGPQPDWARSQQPEWDACSVIAFVMALLGWIIVSIPLGIVGLVRTSGRRLRGRGLAIASLVVSVLWIVLAGIVIVSVVVAFTSIESPRSVFGSLGSLQEGDCLAEAPRTGTERARAVPCSTPHEAQVFATFEQPVTAFAGERELAAAALRACTQRLPEAAKPLRRSLTVEPLVEPAQHGVRERLVVCLVVATGDRLSDSLPGVSDPLADGDPVTGHPVGRSSRNDVRGTSATLPTSQKYDTVVTVRTSRN